MPSDDMPVEQEAVRTTIVGGRPPGSGKPVGPIPRGIEVLLKKAAVDPEFKALLLQGRAEAARAIGLVLDPAEALVLAAAPAAQLESVIAQTTVAPALRPAFLGRAAAVMLVALGAGVATITGEECAAAQATPTSTSQPSEPPAKPSEKTPASAAISADEAAALQARITKDYLQAFADLTARHGVTSKTARLSLALDAAGAVQSVRLLNLAEAGPAEYGDELTTQVMKWKFADLHRACTVLVLLEAPQANPAAAPIATPTAPTRFAIRAVVIGRPPNPAPAQPAHVTVLAEPVAVTKEDAAAMQARIVKEYQAAVVDLANQQGAAGKTARFSLSVSATGGVESVRFLNADEAGNQKFLDSLTGQVLKWTFPGLTRAGDATVSIETMAEAAPPQPAPQMLASAGEMADVPEPAPVPPVAKPGRVTVVPGSSLTPTGEAPAPAAAEKPTSSAAPAATATVPGNLRLRSAGLMVPSPPPPPPAPPPAEQSKATVSASPQQDPELLKVRLEEEKAREADAQKLAAAAKAVEKKADAKTVTDTKVAGAAVSNAEAAAIQDRIAKEYMAAISDLAARQNAMGNAARIAVVIDASGDVQSLQIKNPSEAGSAAFLDALTGQIMKWKFPGAGRACTMMILVETPKESPAPAGEVAAPVAFAIDGMRPAPPPSRVVIQPARVTVFPEVVTITQEDAAVMQARIAKEYQAALVELMGKHGIGGKPVRFSLALNAAGGVDSVKFHDPPQAGGQEFLDRATGQIMGWTFPGLSRLGAATVVIETTLEAAPAQPAPQMMEVAGLRALPPQPLPPTVRPGRVTVVPGIVATPPAEPPAPAKSAPAGSGT